MEDIIFNLAPPHPVLRRTHKSYCQYCWSHTVSYDNNVSGNYLCSKICSYIK